MADSTALAEESPVMELGTFLETVAPGAKIRVSDPRVRNHANVLVYLAPPITLHCGSSTCGGLRTFSCEANPRCGQKKNDDVFFHYVCQNCEATHKTFSIRFFSDADQVTASKFGEEPSFGPPIPARAMTLIGGDRALFLKGRRCELQGLGIAAFTYYRRVIEDQRVRIFDEIIRVLEATDPKNAVIAEIKAAKREQQFSKSIEAIKHALPSSIMINGQNPLRLLHSALSEGVHVLSDEDCLALATAARTVLFEFSERLAQALRDDAELAKAITLLNKKKPAK